jgi:hypothetical protein
LDRALEATWLAAAFLIPLMVMHEEFMLGFIQVVKVSVFRTFALLLIGLIAFDWALHTREERSEGSTARGPIVETWRRLSAYPGRWVIYSVVAVLLANVVSLLLSPVKAIGWSGIDVGWDTYGLYSILGYLVFFAVLVAKLKTQAQIERLIWMLTTVSVVASVYGVGQHFGWDPFRTDSSPVLRAGMTFGNPIFGPSYLAMTIPLTIAAIIPYRDRMPAVTHVWIGAGSIAAQFAAIVFSQSRGPLLGLIVGIAVLLVIIAWVQGWRQLTRPALIVFVAISMTVVINAIPVVNHTSGESFGYRVLNLGPSVSGGTQNRLTIWDTSWDVFTNIPWPDTSKVPSIPDLSTVSLRPLIGYGPDMFGYAYPLAGDTDYTNELATHGHNFIVHTIIELGLFGVAAYLSLLGSVAIILYRVLARARSREYPDWLAYLAIGLAAAMSSRVVEQLVGKAQVSDLHLMWMLIALVVVLGFLASNRESLAEEPVADVANRRERRRGGRVLYKRSAASTSFARLMLAGVIAIMIGFIWTHTVANVFISSIIVKNARDNAAAGESQPALEGFQKAINLAPASAVNKFNFASFLAQAGLQVERPIDERIRLLHEADDAIRKVLERNPMDERAWVLHGEYSRGIAVLDSSRREEAVLAAETLVNLMPGFWQPRINQALSLVMIGLPESSLEVVQEAKELRGLESPGAGLIYFVEASAYEALGRKAEAIEAAHCSLAHHVSSNAGALLERLGAAAPDKLKLTPAEVERCPEVIPKLQ